MYAREALLLWPWRGKPWSDRQFYNIHCSGFVTAQKFSTYFPYNAKLCLNGHEYAKRQLAQRGIGFESLDNGDAPMR